MEPLPAAGDVPAGAILAALDMIQPAQAADSADSVAQEMSMLIGTWGIPVLARAFSTLIGAAMPVVRPTDGDSLHVVVPAVVTQLCKDPYAVPFVPMMAGVLTAAAVFGDDAWRWRPGFGEVDSVELAAWCGTANLLADMADTLVYQEQGAFARMVAELVTGGEEP